MAWVEPHHGGVLTSQLELQQDQAFTDLTLKLQDGEVRTCRLTVASLSHPLYRMLATDMRERNEGVLTLGHVSMADWHCILTFYLSGDKLVTADNVEGVLAIAHLYELEALEKHCGRVLVDTLTSENCFDRLALSKTHVQSAIEGILDFIRENFVTVSRSQRFTSLSKEDVVELLSKPGVVTTEDILCDAILKWLEDNEVDDDTSLEMMQHLKLRELSNEYVCQTLLYHKHVMKNVSLQKCVAEEVMRRQGRNRKNEVSVPTKRNPKTMTGDDVIIFGNTVTGCQSFYCKEGSDAWMELPPQRISDYFAAHKMDDVIYITGGYKAEKATHKFHVPSRTWSRGPDLQEGRYGHAMTSAGDCVFVVAGYGIFYHGNSYGIGNYLSSIEKHETGGDSWQKVGNLPVAVRHSGVAAIGDVIIAAGGWQKPDVIQTFNVTTQTAVLLDTPLPCPMRRVRGASLGSYAVFLGENGDLVQVSLSNNTVTVTSHVRLSGFGSRGFFGLAVKEDRLLCFGGGPETGAGTTADGFNLQGEREDRDTLPQLPVAMRVHGAFWALL